MVFFFYGPNTYAIRQKIQELCRAYINKTGSDFGIERIDGSSISPGDLVSTLTAAPMLATSRLVLVDGLGANKTAAPRIGEALPMVPDTTVAVFYESEVDQRTSYFKTMLKLAKPVKFDKLSSAQLAAWVKKQVAAQEASIEPTALNRLLDTCGDDQWRLEQEILKLSNHDPSITLEAVRNLVPASPSQTIFELVEAVAAGNLKQALGVYRELLQERTSEMYILTMVIWQLRNLLLAKTAGNRSAAEVAKEAGMSPYVAGKALQRQRAFSEATLRQAFFEAVDTDYAIKTGQGEPEALVERLIYRISTLSKGDRHQ